MVAVVELAADVLDVADSRVVVVAFSSEESDVQLIRKSATASARGRHRIRTLCPVRRVCTRAGAGHRDGMITVAQLRQVLHELDDEDDAEVIVEFPGGSFRPVDGLSVRSAPSGARQLIVLADIAIRRHGQSSNVA